MMNFALDIKGVESFPQTQIHKLKITITLQPDGMEL